MIKPIIDNKNLIHNLPQFIFFKDKNGRYTGCNENFAEGAGLDSPQSIVGKSDYDLVWKKQADIYRLGDQQTLEGKPLFMAPELQTRISGYDANVLTWKSVINDSRGKILGISGIAIEITGYHLVRKSGFWDRKKKVLRLDGYIDGEFLTRRETQVLHLILKQKTARQAAEILFISPKTVESHIEKIRRKLQCSTKMEIVFKCIQSGLVWIFFENSDWVLEKK